jgi:hypothetical protein
MPPYFLLYIEYTRKYYDCCKNHSSDSDGFTCFEPFRIPKYFFGMPSACLYVHMNLHLSRTWTAGWVLFIYNIYVSIHHRSVLKGYEHSSSKNTATLEVDPRTKWQFFFKWLKQFGLNFSHLQRPSPCIKLHRWYIQENNDTHTRCPNIK